jgi:glycine cleavage system H protein
MIVVRGCEFPEDRCYHAFHNVWLQAEEGGKVTLGATSFGAAQAVEFLAFMPKPLGAEIEADRAVGLIELWKTLVPVRTPVAGTLVAANDAVSARPALINEDPYGAGWLVKLQVPNWEEARRKLVAGEAIAPAFEKAMHLDNFAGRSENR